MTERCFISLAEIPGIRRQLKSSIVVINKLTESDLKSCALLAPGQKLERKLRNSEATETKLSVEKGKTGGNEEDRSPVKNLRLKISSTSDTSSMTHSKNCIPISDKPLESEILPDNSTCISEVDL